jgi:hypothetical protein
MLTETEKEAPQLSEFTQRGLNMGPRIALGKLHVSSSLNWHIYLLSTK